jgi:hypothetical protein
MADLRRRPGAASDETESMLGSDLRSMVESISKREGGVCKAQITLSVWENESGGSHVTLDHDDGLTDLQLKGYLHDALWTIAHSTDVAVAGD